MRNHCITVAILATLVFIQSRRRAWTFKVLRCMWHCQRKRRLHESSQFASKLLFSPTIAKYMGYSRFESRYFAICHVLQSFPFYWVYSVFVISLKSLQYNKRIFSLNVLPQDEFSCGNTFKEKISMSTSVA